MLIGDVDLSFDDLRELANGHKGALKCIKRCRHFHLIYGYRNYLVHEFREPGYAMELFGEGQTEPSYHSYLNNPVLRLLYPVGFFRRLAEQVVATLEAWFIENDENPYNRVHDSSAWRS